MPAELEAVDRLLDDPRLFEPFRRWFDPELGRPSIPIECHLRLMFLKNRYRLGYEALCAEASDSLTWLRFCRIRLGESAPHPSTLMKITTRCGSEPIDGLNARLLAAAVEAGIVDVGWLPADTTVMPADIRYPTDSGLLVRGITKAAVLVARFRPPVLRHAPLSRTRQACPGRPRTGSARSCARWPAGRTAGSPPRCSSTCSAAFIGSRLATLPCPHTRTSASPDPSNTGDKN